MSRSIEIGWGPRSRRGHIIVEYRYGKPVTRCAQTLPGLTDSYGLESGEILPDGLCPGCSAPGHSLGRDPAGNYFTADRRFTVTRTTMGQGVNNNGGWSNGRTVWRIEDMTGATPFGERGIADRAFKTVDTLWEARALIDHVYRQEDGR